MKKYILLAASLLATSTLADNFYLKGGVGLNSFTPFKVQEKELTTKSKLMHNFPLLEVGIGYNLGDRLRTELVYDYYFKFNNKEEYNSDSLVANVIRKNQD